MNDIHPALRRLEMFSQQTFVASIHIEFPRQGNARIRPTR